MREPDNQLELISSRTIVANQTLVTIEGTIVRFSKCATYFPIFAHLLVRETDNH